MASDRVSRETAELCPLPPYSWYWKPASFILEQEIVAQNIEKAIPVNKELMENIKSEGIKNPFMCLHSWWPFVGGQRMKAIYEIRKTDKNYDPIIQVAKFDKPYENIWFLWGDKDFRTKANAVQYQLWELIFKSQWYNYDKTDSGVNMKHYENVGDSLSGWQS
jgi:hypothetical protein